MIADAEPKLTFWSIPPFRKRVQAITRIEMRDARLLLAQFYGSLYLLYGMKIPVVLWLVTASFIGTGPAAVDFLTTVIPYLILAVFACGFAGAGAGAGVAWVITGRALRSRNPSRVRFALFGALAASVPVVPLLAVVPGAPSLVVTGFLVWLVGAGLGTAFHWIVQRDRANVTQIS